MINQIAFSWPVSIFFLFLTSTCPSVTIAQTKVCRGDSAIVVLKEYRGSIQWQQSLDSVWWQDMSGQTRDTLPLLPDTNAWYRALVTDSGCGPVLSPVYWVGIKGAPLPPVAKAASNVQAAQFQVNFDPSEDANSYYLDVSKKTDFSTFIPGYQDKSIGNVTSFIVSGLVCKTTYYYRVRPAGPCGLGTHSNTISVTMANCPTHNCGTALTDPRDGRTYATVSIAGSATPYCLASAQCWMAQGLNVGTMIPGNTNPTNGPDNQQFSIEKYCYQDNPAHCNEYGALFHWNEAMAWGPSVGGNGPGPQGVCPPGWHIPTDNEFKCMEMNLGMLQIHADGTSDRGTTEGGKLKEDGFNHWALPNTGATNSSGFRGLPGGYRIPSGGFELMGNYGLYWTSTENGASVAHRRTLEYDSAEVPRGFSNKPYGFSLRCVKD